MLGFKPAFSLTLIDLIFSPNWWESYFPLHVLTKSRISRVNLSSEASCGSQKDGEHHWMVLLTAFPHSYFSQKKVATMMQTIHIQGKVNTKTQASLDACFSILAVWRWRGIQEWTGSLGLADGTIIFRMDKQQGLTV